MSYDPNQPRVQSGPDGGQWQADGVGAAAQEIADTIEHDDDEYADYGLRVIDKDYDGYDSVAVGSELDESSQWSDGEYTSEGLGGSSVSAIEDHSHTGVMKALKNLGATGANGPNGYYLGDKVLLVKGERKMYGEDVGEWVIKDPVVVGVWRKHTSGLSEIRPNVRH